MASKPKNAEDQAETIAETVPSFSETPGVSADAEVLDTPLALPVVGPRDALVDPEPQDYVPDIDEKGYHVGMVRQPADIVGTPTAGPQGFRSQGGESKFAYGSLAHLKAVHNERERGGIPGSVAPSPNPTAEETANPANTGRTDQTS